MRKLVYIFGLFLISFSLSAQSLNIIEAVDKKIVDCRIRGSWDYAAGLESIDADGLYFGKCMTIRIRSKSPDTISLYIPNGLMLLCDDTLTQDMVVTRYCHVTIAPRQVKTLELYAMCSEIHDGSPSKEKSYKVGSMADEDLVAITGVIDRVFCHNIIGQSAVWAYTDNATEDALRMYGATDTSLKMTISMLNEAGVVTKLNSPVAADTQIKDTVVISKNPAVYPEGNQSDITLSPYIVYSGAGLIIILLGMTSWLIISRKKNNKSIPPAA